MPTNQSKDNIEYVRWQRDNNKFQRNIYIGLAAMLSSIMIQVVTHYTDKFDRYMRFKLKEEDKKEK